MKSLQGNDDGCGGFLWGRQGLWSLVIDEGGTRIKDGTAAKVTSNKRLCYELWLRLRAVVDGGLRLVRGRLQWCADIPYPFPVGASIGAFRRSVAVHALQEYN